MKVALVITVKNEERILRHNLLYHKAIGICKAFIYFDNTSDNGKKSISDLDFVEVSDSVLSDKYNYIEELTAFTSKSKKYHTARQCLNTYDAIQKSKNLKIDWLISLDADELVFTHKSKDSDLILFFNKIDTNINLVNFKPYEILQTKPHYNNVFSEAVYFKATHKFERRIDTIYKTFFNPFTNRYVKFSYWYGQHIGKSAIRISSDKDIIPRNVHRYQYKDNTAIKAQSRFGLIHYHMYDAEDFIKKYNNFKDRPDTFLSGNKVESLKLLCRDIINSKLYSKEELIDYFKSYVMFSSQALKSLSNNRSKLFVKRKQPSIVMITSVQSVFRNLLNPTKEL